MTRGRVPSLHQPVVLGAGPRDADRVAFLEGIRTDQRRRHLAGDADQRDRIHQRVLQAASLHWSRRARRSPACTPGLAGRARIAFGRMAGALLVAHENVLQLRPAGRSRHRSAAPRRRDSRKSCLTPLSSMRATPFPRRSSAVSCSSPKIRNPFNRCFVQGPRPETRNVAICSAAIKKAPSGAFELRTRCLKPAELLRHACAPAYHKNDALLHFAVPFGVRTLVMWQTRVNWLCCGNCRKSHAATRLRPSRLAW